MTWRCDVCNETGDCNWQCKCERGCEQCAELEKQILELKCQIAYLKGQVSGCEMIIKSLRKGKRNDL